MNTFYLSYETTDLTQVESLNLSETLLALRSAIRSLIFLGSGV